ncbi:MAG TPA: M20 family metallopeptidase [Candidatus Tectomicrobia bacterium]|jgi:amidohydrolase|nr:M20 family metallopeptidase [Candidatus Tectomicrobia bacterium]
MSQAARDPRMAYAQQVTRTVEALRQELVDISLDIHAHPELNYQEHHAARALADALERHGFQVERGVGGVETAFRGVIQGGKGDGPTVALLAEYDALPGIGHGCGHNLIAMSNLGAGLGVKAVMESLPGRVIVLGTPAEEGGGGKIRLLDASVFKGVDVALSSHPSSNRTIIPADIPQDQSWSLAMVGYRYAFHGKAAHAAVVPHEGINALNAVIHLFTGIDALRQHLREDVRIHGIITDGGKAPNVVPDFAAANFMLRSRDREYLHEVVDKVRRVAEGAAQITGARLEVLPAHPLYENVRPNAVLAQAARANAQAVGMPLDAAPVGWNGGGASTDFGNVSQALPAYYLRFAVSRQPVPGHSTAMAEAAKSDFGHDNAIATAKVLALTVCDLLAHPDLVAAAKADFAARAR